MWCILIYMHRAFLVALSLTCAAPTAPADDPVMTRTPAGDYVHWDRSVTPVILVPAPGMDPWYRPLKAAARFWNEAIGTSVFIVGAPAGVEPDELRPYEGPVLIFYSTEPATRIYYDEATGRVMAAWMQIQPDELDDEYTRYLRMVHELGHILGLATDQNTQSIMSDTPVLKPRLMPEDRAALKALYGEFI